MLTPAIRANRASPQKEQRCGLLRTFARAGSITIAPVASTPPAAQRRIRTTRQPLLGGHVRQIGECGVKLGFFIRPVLEFACLKIDVGLHIEVTVTTEVEQYRPGDPF